MRTKYQSHRTEQWQQIMTDFAASGLTQKQFCSQQGLAPSTFSKWRKQLGLVQAPSTTNEESHADFQPFMSMALASPTDVMPVAQYDNTVSDWDVELALGSGMTLRIRTSG